MSLARSRASSRTRLLPSRSWCWLGAAALLGACATGGATSDEEPPSNVAGSNGQGGDSFAGSGAFAGDSSVGGEATAAGGSGGASTGGAGHAGSGGDAGKSGESGNAGASGSAGHAGSGGANAGGAAAGNASTGGAGAGGSTNGGTSATGGATTGGNGGASATGGTSAVGGDAAGGSGGTTGGAAGTSASGASGAGGMTAVLDVVSIAPTDGSTNVPASSAVTITFNAAVDPMSVGDATGGACSGTVQLSCDDFTDCLATAVAVSGTAVIVTPASPLPAGATCKVHVTNAATSTGGASLATAYDSAGFTVAGGGGTGCSGPSVVISQIYGGGGDSGATLTTDFVELFNRSGSAVSVDGWSVQYGPAGGTSWQVTKLTGSIPAGGYYLVAEATGTGGTKSLPKADVTGVIAMAQKAGQVALVNVSTALAAGSCPMNSKVVDIVPYGTVSSCISTPAPSVTKSVSRSNGGCLDGGDVSNDFTVTDPNPRNSATSPMVCGSLTCN